MEIVEERQSTWKQIGSGLRAYGKALALVTGKRLYWMFLFPFLLSALLFVGGFAAVNELTAIAIDYINSLIAFDAIAEGFSGFAETALRVTIWVLLKIAFFFLFAYIGGYLVIIVMSPVLSYVSERAEFHFSGYKHPFKAGEFFRNAVRGVMIALRNFFFQTLISLGLLLVGLIPVVGLAAPFLMIAVSAYFYGFSFMDYFLERKIPSISNSVSFIRKRRFKALGLGLPFVLLLTIPVAGTFLAGFLTVVSTIAATISLDEENNEYLKYR